MSFSFSVGDIILVGQLSYRLYDTLSTDNGPVAKELGNALFGLRCALDHLGRQATEISLQTSYDGDQLVNEMHRNLDTMIASCAATLTEIEKLFAKYANGSQCNSSPGPRISPRAEQSTRDKLRSSLSRLQNTVKTGSMRVRWSKDSQIFAGYREKLQSHADAINMVLTTFLWSSSQRIEKASKLNTEKIQHIREEVQHSNAELFSLINGIHAMVLKSNQNEALPEPMILDDQDSLPALAAGCQGLTVQANFASSTPANPTPFRKGRPPSSALMPQYRKRVTSPLSTDLLEINRSRSAIGREQFMLFKKQYRISDVVPRVGSETDPNSFFRVEPPTVLLAAEELEKIVSKLSSQNNRTGISNDIATQQLHRWLQGFEAIIDSWPSISGATKVDKQRQQKDGHALMLILNFKISEVIGSVQKQIYEALDINGIDRIFARLRESLDSVMVEKEIQMYEDEKASLE